MRASEGIFAEPGDFLGDLVPTELCARLVDLAWGFACRGESGSGDLLAFDLWPTGITIGLTIPILGAFPAVEVRAEDLISTAFGVVETRAKELLGTSLCLTKKWGAVRWTER